MKTHSSKKFDGKQLLVLGSNAASEYIVKYAQGCGAHVIVADYLTPEKSPAKLIADEDLLMSTADLDALELFVRERKIDGVFAGISEFNILQSMELARRCGLPFYCSRSQWDQLESKDCFRDLCIRNSVPCPETYFSGSNVSQISWSDVSYPVVLKPVDCGASLGVHLCQNEREVKGWLDDSMSKSDAGRVILEQCCTGHEFTAHYVIHRGEAALACIDNRYPVAVHNGAVTTIPAARIYPCLFIDEFKKQVNTPMINLLKSLKLENAVIFIQGLYDEKKNKFSIFEAGLRSAAEAPFRFIEQINGVNYMNMLIDQVLLGKADGYNILKEDPYLKGKCCGIVSLVGRHGVVANIDGLDEVLGNLEGIVDYEVRYPVGSEIPDTDTLRQLAIRFVIMANNRCEMVDLIKRINESVRVLDSNGESLVVPFDALHIHGL